MSRFLAGARLRMFWILVMPLLICACSRGDLDNPPSTAVGNVMAVGLLSLAVAAAILMLVGAYKYSLGAAGVVVGLILGAAIITSVPLSVQYAVIGGILGVSGDFVASGAKTGKPATMVESLSGFVIRVSKAAHKAGEKAKLEQDQRKISILI